MRLAPEGRIIVIPLFFITGILIWLWAKMGISIYAPAVFGAFLLFCLNFFRDPARSIPVDKTIVVSPADGKVVKIEEINDPDLGGHARLVSIF